VNAGCKLAPRKIPIMYRTKKVTIIASGITTIVSFRGFTFFIFKPTTLLAVQTRFKASILKIFLDRDTVLIKSLRFLHPVLQVPISKIFPGFFVYPKKCRRFGKPGTCQRIKPAMNCVSQRLFHTSQCCLRLKHGLNIHTEGSNADALAGFRVVDRQRDFNLINLTTNFKVYIAHVDHVFTVT